MDTIISFAQAVTRIIKLKYMFGKEFWTKVIIDVVLIGIVSVGFISWLNYKFNKKLKDYEPLTAEEILRKENFLNSKRDAFFETIQLLSKSFASTSWTGDQIPKNRIPESSRPTEVEINSCFSKLCLYVDNKEILEKFPYLFTSNSSPTTIGNYISLLREDLGYGESIIDSTKFPYIFNSK